MAQVVDTRGNVRSGSRASNPRHGNKNGGGLNALKRALDPDNQLRPWENVQNAPTPGTETLKQSLDRASSSNQIRQSTRQSASPRTPTFAMPTVGTSSMPSSTFSRNRYTGISGGTPVTSASRRSSQEWSPIYGSLLDDGEGSEGDGSRFGGMRGDKIADIGTDQLVPSDQQSEDSGEKSNELTPKVKTNSSSSSGMDNRGIDYWNSVYEKDMVDRGLSPDYIDKVLKESNTVSAAIDTKNGLDDQWRQDLLAPVTTQVDDGTLDRQHLLSDWMTGKQYYHYVHDLGMPGMPEDEIDISKHGLYSKTQERQENGFPLYIPNSIYELGLSVPGLASASRSLKNYISNIRTHGFLGDVDYGITTDTGHGVHSFSGNDFDRLKDGYASRVQNLYDRASKGDSDAISMLTDAKRHSEPYTTMVHEFELPDGSKHYGIVTDEHEVNDLENEDVLNDLLWWNIDDDTTLSYPDENGTSTYGNVTLNLDGNNNILSGTWHTKDGFDLNVRPSEDGGFQLVTDDDAFEDWWNSHYTGSRYIEFSDGSSATVPSEDIGEDDSWKKDSLVQYDKTSLKDIDGFDVDSLNADDLSSLSQAGVIYVPDMVLPDGTSISRDVVFDIANDEDPYDSDKDGISYEFEPSGFSPKRLPFPLSVISGLSNPILSATDSRPRRLMHDSIVDEDGLHLGFPETFDWLADAGADSIPISTPVYQWIDAGAQAMPYAAGIEPSSNNGYGRYQTTGYDSGSDENAFKFGATILGPYLENLAGYGHKPLFDPVAEKLINDRFAEGTLQNLLLSKGWDSIGEAIEEVIGNYVDELSTYGPKGAWADPISRLYAGMGKVYDKDHNLLYNIPDDISDKELSDIYDDIMSKGNGRFPMLRDLVNGHGSEFPVLYDEHGREFRDPDTPLGYRFANALWPSPGHLIDTLNAAAGGGGVSMLYSMPEIMYGLGSNLMTNRKKDKDRNFSQDEWSIGTSDDMSDANGSLDDIRVPESLKSDRILSNDYRINPGAPIRFKE